MRVSILTTAILTTTAHAFSKKRLGRNGHNEAVRRNNQAGELLRTSTDDALCLGLENQFAQNNQAVVLQACDDAKTARWRRQGTALVTGKDFCLDVPNGNNENGQTLQVYTCVPGNTNQEWQELGEQLEWLGSNKCLDVQDGCFNEDATVQLYQCYDYNTNQEFSLGALTAPITSATIGLSSSAATVITSTTAPATTAATTAAAVAQTSAASTAVTAAGSYLGFSYISFDAFMTLHPVLEPLRQDILDAAASVNIGLPPILLGAEALQESSGDPAAAGGGLGQFSPDTWATFGQGDIENGRDNLFAIARYLKYLLAAHNNDLSAALNEYCGDLSFYVGDIRSWLQGNYVYGAGT